MEFEFAREIAAERDILQQFADDPPHAPLLAFDRFALNANLNHCIGRPGLNDGPTLYTFISSSIASPVIGLPIVPANSWMLRNPLPSCPKRIHARLPPPASSISSPIEVIWTASVSSS